MPNRTMEGFNRVAFRRKQQSLDIVEPKEAGETLRNAGIPLS